MPEYSYMLFWDWLSIGLDNEICLVTHLYDCRYDISISLFGCDCFMEFDYYEWRWNFWLVNETFLGWVMVWLLELKMKCFHFMDCHGFWKLSPFSWGKLWKEMSNSHFKNANTCNHARVVEFHLKMSSRVFLENNRIEKPYINKVFKIQRFD